ASSGAPPAEQPELKALAAACREPDLAQRAEKLNKMVDVDRFLTLAALEVMTWHWDGYAMHANNYRVYHDPDSGKMTVIPPGMAQSCGNRGGRTGPPWGGRIARRMFQMPGLPRPLLRPPDRAAADGLCARQTRRARGRVGRSAQTGTRADRRE